MVMGRLVFPGSFLSAAEEFSAGENAFESESGGVYADSVGEENFDKPAREVSVAKKTRLVKPLEQGSTVIGRVVIVREQTAVIELLSAEKGSEPRIVTVGSASLPVFNVSNAYVKDMHSMFRIGDIVKATIAKIMPCGVDLSTKEPECGVIKAFCVNCRHPLGLFNEDLKCGNCGNSETRKISSDYILK